MTTNQMPALFVGHGSPMNVLDGNNPINQGFAEIVKTFAKPKAILCISAHWYSSKLQIQTNPNPPMIYDFHGFPDELYQVEYPAKGSNELAGKVCELLADDGIIQNPTRGYDHGAWAVLKHLYPDAAIPVVQLLLHRSKTADEHWSLAQKLRPLRDEGVLILGSGDIVHNLGVVSWQHINTLGAGYDWAYEFRDAINQAIESQDKNTLTHFEDLGESAHLSVPTLEHYLPLLYALAVRDDDDKVQIFNDILVGGSVSMTSVLVG